MRGALLVLCAGIIACASVSGRSVSTPTDEGQGAFSATPQVVAPPTLSDEEAETYRRLRLQGGGEGLLEAALGAEGMIDPVRRRALERRLREAFERLVPGLPDAAAEVRAEALLQALHREVLRRFVPAQWSVSATIEEGTYSDLTASIVFAVAAGWLGLEAGAAVTPRWSLAWAEVDGRRALVQASSADGFDWRPDDVSRAAFLGARGLAGATWRAPSFEPATVLAARVASLRLALEHDGRMPEDDEHAVRLLPTVLALAGRALALAPADRVWGRMAAIRIERQAVRRVEAGAFEEGAMLQRIALVLSGGSATDEARARNNLRWATGRRVAAALRTPDFATVDAALEQAEASLSCERAPADCQNLREHLREVFWADAIARDEAEPGAGWPIVAALLDRFPPGRAQNVSYFVGVEYARRWQADPMAADAFLKALLERTACADELRSACAELEARAAVHWFPMDPATALSWARAAHRHDPTVGGLKENYAAALRVELGRRAEADDCDAVWALAAELSQAGLAGADAEQFVTACMGR